MTFSIVCLYFTSGGGLDSILDLTNLREPHNPTVCIMATFTDAAKELAWEFPSPHYSHHVHHSNSDCVFYQADYRLQYIHELHYLPLAQARGSIFLPTGEGEVVGLSATGAVSRHRLDRLNKGNYLREKKGGGRLTESIQREVVRAASDTKN